MAISFDLHVLGWKAFEDLAGCIFGDVLGQTLEVFAAGVDGGRDAAFVGTWLETETGETYTGSFCIQCKHTSKATRAISLAAIRDELEKVTRLAEAGLADNYFLVTNYSVPAGLAADIEMSIIESGAKTARVFGAEWISSKICENPKLRRLVPRLYGLGDLTQIVTHQAYRQAIGVLESIAPDLATFVPTEAYRRSAHALQEHGFVLLIGEPASGKTTIANLLAISAADEWDLQTLMISRPEDFSNLWNPDDPGQFLWVDDAFGSTQYDPNRVAEWNQLLPKLKAAIKGGARVVFTSRDYIFASARRDLELSAFELLSDSRVLIEVEKLVEIERQMILYNHLKSGAQPKTFKTAIKPYLQDAVGVTKFLPEIARRLANPKFTSRMRVSREGLITFFEKPVDVLLDVVSSIAQGEKAAIGLVFISGGRLPIPVASSPSTLNTLELLGATLGEVKAALSSLDDSLLRRVRDSDQEFWVFRHPTIRDAYATLVGTNPELIDIYLAGVTAEQMMTEITCGASGVEGAKIVVPPDRYDLVIGKLRDSDLPKTFWGSPVKTFLSTRCSPKFITKYFQSGEVSECIPTGGAWAISSAHSGLRILSTLSASGMLPEPIRKETADTILRICEQEHSCRFADSPWVTTILTKNEIDDTLRRVGEQLFTTGEEVISNLEADWDKESDPEDLFYEITRTLRMIESDNRFTAEEQGKAGNLQQRIADSVMKMSEKREEKTYDKLDTEAAKEAAAQPQGRSVFEDVDE